jgi:hypothetical protein
LVPSWKYCHVDGTVANMWWVMLAMRKDVSRVVRVYILIEFMLMHATMVESGDLLGHLMLLEHAIATFHR